MLTTTTSDEDFYIRGNDGGTTRNALTLDMSAGGNATFSGNITVSGGNVTSQQFTDTSDSSKYLNPAGTSFITSLTASSNLTSLTANFSDNVFLSGGQLYLGASGSSTDNSYRMYVTSGQFVLASRKSGTWTTYFDINTSGNATFAGDVVINDGYLEVQKAPAAAQQTIMIDVDCNPTGNTGSGIISLSAGSNNQAKTQIEQVTSGGSGSFGTYIDTNIINKGLSTSAHGNINFVTGSSTSASSIVMTIGGGSQKGNVGIGTTGPQSKLQVAGGIQMADDTATAVAAKVGTLRYRTSGNNSYVDMCMQTAASTYAWINIVQNNW